MTRHRTPITDALTRTRQHQAEPFSCANLVAALEAAWSTIRSRHVDVPGAVIVVGSGSPARPNGRLVFGHFAALQWQHGGDRVPEVLVSGEGLNRPAADVLTTLLHEAAHAVADVRGIKDTSRQGRWHNKHFAALAGELGLAVTKDDKLGWSPSTLRPETSDAYADVIDELAAAIRVCRHHNTHRAATTKNSRNGSALTCECPRRIRAATAVIAEGPIVCGVCTHEFISEDSAATVDGAA